MRLIKNIVAFGLIMVLGFGTAVVAQTDGEGKEVVDKVGEVAEEVESLVYNQMLVEFYSALGAHFGVSAEEIESVMETGLVDDELAATLFISTNGNASATEIAARRVAGEAWYALYQSQGLYSNDFWIPLRGNEDKQIFFRLVDLMKGKWDATLILKDQEVINLSSMAWLRTDYPKMTKEMSDLRAYGLEFSYIHHRARLGAAEAAAAALESTEE